MMLEVDVEGNRILLTEHLALQATDGRRRSENGRPRHSISGRGFVSSYHAFAHFLAGLLTLFILAIVVYLASHRNTVQCSDRNDDDNEPSTIANNIQDCIFPSASINSSS